MIKLHLDTQHLDLDSDLKEYLEGRIKDIWFAYSGREDGANINHCGLEFTFDVWVALYAGHNSPEKLIGDMDGLNFEINKPNWEYITHKMLREEAKQDYINSYEP